MHKRIIIIGGGISGLSALHYLKKKYSRPDATEILLLEKNSYLGGTARTQYYPEFSFEEGANGFLDSKESTLSLVHDLGISDQLIHADPRSKARFICVNNKLVELPTSPAGLLKFPLLSVRDKLRIGAEIFIPRSDINNETIFAFVQRRLGVKFAKYFIDPMVTGIFGGQAEQLILRYAFPKMYELERDHGSLFKAMIAIQKKNKMKEKITGEPKGQLTSLRRGMSQLMDTLARRYSEHIKLTTPAISVKAYEHIWKIKTAASEYEADEVFICTPAYVAAELMQEQDAILAQALSAIEYAPIAVIGCLFDQKQLSRIPRGFGYLIPSSERKDVLGVLFDTNLFPERTEKGYFLIRLMIGGGRRPHVVDKSEKELLAIAASELEASLGITSDPIKVATKIWKKAIPQYNAQYVKNLSTIHTCLSQNARLHLLSNYIGGVSLNDCVANALTAVEGSNC